MSQRRTGAGSCLVCEAWALGDLCPRCEARAGQDPPQVLEKLTPPKDAPDFPEGLHR